MEWGKKEFPKVQLGRKLSSIALWVTNTSSIFFLDERCLKFAGTLMRFLSHRLFYRFKV